MILFLFILNIFNFNTTTALAADPAINDATKISTGKNRCQKEGSLDADLSTAYSKMSLDPCYRIPVNDAARWAAIEGIVTYGLVAGTCGVACGYALPPLVKACSIASMAAPVVDSGLSALIKQKGEEFYSPSNLIGLTSGVGLGLIGMTSAGSQASSAASSAGSTAGQSASQGPGMSMASCLMAGLAGVMIASKAVLISERDSDSDEAYKQKFDISIDSSNVSTDLSAPTINQNQLGSNEPSPSNQTREGQVTSSINRNNPTENQNRPSSLSSNTSGLRARSRPSEIPSTTQELYRSKNIDPNVLTSQLMDGKISPQQLQQAVMESFGAPPSFASGLISKNDQFYQSIRTQPQYKSYLASQGMKKSGSAGAASDYANATSRSQRKTNNAPDFQALLANALAPLSNNGKAGEARRDPASQVQTLKLLQSLGVKDPVPGVQYFPPGDTTTLFDVIHRSYGKLINTP